MLIPVKIGIFDQDLASLQDLMAFLKKRKQCKLVFACSDLEALPSLVSTHQPSILLIEVIQEGRFNLKPVEEMRRQFPELELIAFSTLASVVWIRKLYQEGVGTFVSKHGSWVELDRVISEIVSGLGGLQTPIQ